MEPIPIPTSVHTRCTAYQPPAWSSEKRVLGKRYEFSLYMLHSVLMLVLASSINALTVSSGTITGTRCSPLLHQTQTFHVAAVEPDSILCILPVGKLNARWLIASSAVEECQATESQIAQFSKPTGRPHTVCVQTHFLYAANGVFLQ